MTVAVSPAIVDASSAKTLQRWRVHLVWLGACWAGLLLLFRRDVLDLAHLYWTNTTFGHCLFVGPVIAWLVWQRRRELAQLTPQGWVPGLAVVGVGGAIWAMGEVAGVALFRHAGLVLSLQGAAIALLGQNVARGLLFPLAYMAFLVPFGEFLEAPLQDLTVTMVMPLLHLFGVPAAADGVLITTSNGFFEVAEACSGAKFLIAMTAYGVLVANVCYRSWRRRAAFMAMALVVPVIANGLRAFGTIYAAWWTSVEAATGFDHIVYGWVFFGLVMAVVLAIGWRWFDRDPDAPWFDPTTLQGPVRWRVDVGVAAMLVLTIATLSLTGGQQIARRETRLPAALVLPSPAGWQRVAPARDWTPNFPAADRFVLTRYVDAHGQAIDLAIAAYAGQREGKEMVGFGIGAIRENDRWVKVSDLPDLSDGHALRMIGPGRVERETVSWYRVGGIVTGSDNRVKLETLKAKLTGGDPAGVAVLISAPRSADGAPGASITDFLAASGPIERIARDAIGAH